MTAQEMDDMFCRMKDYGFKENTRSEFDLTAFYLARGLYAIGRSELAAQLENLYEEMENVCTDDLMKLGTFE